VIEKLEFKGRRA